MKLLLDEMISFRVAAELRKQGHDVVAIKRDRPDLESAPDGDIVRQATREGRTVVTNNVKDYLPLHQRFVASGEDHAGMLFTTDQALPRSNAALNRWVQTLDHVLASNPGEDAFKTKYAFIP